MKIHLPHRFAFGAPAHTRHPSRRAPGFHWASICTVRAPVPALADTSANPRQRGLTRNDVSTK